MRVRAWQPDGIEAVLHWVNYRQDESSDIEVPQPVGPLQVSLAVPDGQRVRVEWLYPEREEAVVLPHHRRPDEWISRCRVWGLSGCIWTEFLLPPDPTPERIVALPRQLRSRREDKGRAGSASVTC